MKNLADSYSIIVPKYFKANNKVSKVIGFGIIKTSLSHAGKFCLLSDTIKFLTPDAFAFTTIQNNYFISLFY